MVTWHSFCYGLVIIAAWLHDIASVTDYNLYAEHHIYGTQIAEEILKRFDYEEDRIQKVQKCILNHRGSVKNNKSTHRGSVKNNKSTLEELCVADADAISHFDNVPGLLYLAYVRRGLDIEEGKGFVKNKLERSFQKLSDLSKEFYWDKYNKIMEILE